MLKVKYENYSSASIDAYHEDFALIWKRDADDRSVFDLWLHIVDHAARIARAVRRQRPAEVTDDVADTTVWLFSFIAHCKATKQSIDGRFKFDESPANIIWNKYPSICPSCFNAWIISILALKEGESHEEKFRQMQGTIQDKIREKVSQYNGPSLCTCLIRTITHAKEKEVAISLKPHLILLRKKYANLLKNSGHFIENIDKLEQMFATIFANVHHVTSLEIIAFHLLEEVGEATQALKDCYTYDDAREPYTLELQESRKSTLLDEIADIFSWLITIAIKIKTTYGMLAEEYKISIRKRSITTSPEHLISFANILWAKYGMTSLGSNWDNLKCPGCQASPCDCKRDLKISWESYEKNKMQLGKEEIKNPRDLIFISYSHKDEQWLEKLTKMLNPLIRNKTISIWDDTKIKAGQNWKSEIVSALSRTRVAILLVTDNFLSSDFIAEKELPPLLDAADKDGATIFWIPVSPCLVKETEIYDYQAAFNSDDWLSLMSEPLAQKALLKIAEKLKVEALN